jgi:glycerophosphoryl diester phosphodiesterase
VRPLIISHAACGGHAAENTLAGVRKAIDFGSEAIEIDVQASSDGVPVLMHDVTVDRSTSGSGYVAEMTFEELRALDVGGEPVPTLAEALELTRGRVLLVMEIKAPGIEEHVARVVNDASAIDDVMTWSFFPDALKGMRAAEKRIPGALLIGGEHIGRWPEMRETALRLGLQGVSPFHLGISPEIVESCRRSGLALYSWTADEEAQIQHLVDLGVDGVCSNFPDRVRRVLERAG